MDPVFCVLGVETSNETSCALVVSSMLNKINSMFNLCHRYVSKNNSLKRYDNIFVKHCF